MSILSFRCIRSCVNSTSIAVRVRRSVRLVLFFNCESVRTSELESENFNTALISSARSALATALRILIISAVIILTANSVGCTRCLTCRCAVSSLGRRRLGGGGGGIGLDDRRGVKIVVLFIIITLVGI